MGNKKTSFNRFSYGQSWTDQVLDADKIWDQVKSLLDTDNATLPKTPRKPDLRLIIENTSGGQIQFKNPAGHSGDAPQDIPANGDKKAIMVMLAGATLEEQVKNAQYLYETYDLAENGLNRAFLDDLESTKLKPYLDEAYGPAPYQDQVDRLEPLNWKNQDGSHVEITPVKGQNASFGTRIPETETVFLAKFHISVKGTGTAPELIENDGINIAVSTHYKTGKVSTRPIVPSVAKGYYGEHTANIPVAIVDPFGTVKELHIQGRQTLNIKTAPAVKQKPQKP